VRDKYCGAKKSDLPIEHASDIDVDMAGCHKLRQKAKGRHIDKLVKHTSDMKNLPDTTPRATAWLA
jgi:hypothetical protein